MSTSQTSATSPSSTGEHVGSDGVGTGTDGLPLPQEHTAKTLIAPTSVFGKSVIDAEELLSFAANTGQFPSDPVGSKGFKAWVIEAIVNAQLAVKNKQMSKETAVAFWASFADLSRVTSPVTADSLRASRRDLFRLAVSLFLTLLVFIVVLISVYLFANTAMTNQLSQIIDEQNKAALRLWSNSQYFKAAAEADGEQSSLPRGASEGGGLVAAGRNQTTSARSPNVAVVRVTPDEFFGEVVDFARKNVSLRQTAWQYNTYFILRPFKVSTKPIDFEDGDPEGVTRLNVSPEISKLSEIIAEAAYQIKAYQRIRDFAESAYKGNLILWNGITAYLLPAVYALLGAGLYDSRLYAEMVKQKRHLRSPAGNARYLIAFIVGSVIGLFGSLLPQNPSVPPLGIAFVVGYAVEAFLSRLDGVMAKLKGDASTSSSPAVKPTIVVPSTQRAANE